jgi:hypothetical protein
MASTRSLGALALSLWLVGPLSGCGDSVTPLADAGSDGGAELEDGGGDPDAGVVDPDAGRPISPGCEEAVRSVALGGRGLRAIGLAPLGDGWAIAVEDELGERSLVRTDASGTPARDAISLGTGPFLGRGAIGARPLDGGVLVRAGTGVRWFLPNGDEPFAALTDLEPLVLGPSTGGGVIGIAGNDVVRIRLDGALVVERFPTGLELAPHVEPTGGYVTPAAMGVSADGCLALADSVLGERYGSIVRTIPIAPGAGCEDTSHNVRQIGSIGVFDTLASGSFVMVAGEFPMDVATRSHIARLYRLDEFGPAGEQFGQQLSYGVRAAIASAPDRTIIATAHASPYGDGRIWFWREGTTAPIDEDGASEHTSVYLAWHPALDRIAAVYGADSAGYTEWEHTLSLRCDL